MIEKILRILEIKMVCARQNYTVCHRVCLKRKILSAPNRNQRTQHNAACRLAFHPQITIINIYIL